VAGAGSDLDGASVVGTAARAAAVEGFLAEGGDSMNRKAIGLGFVCLLATGANAQTFIGSFEVDDGPNWSTNPPVYSGLDAAALLFGGSPSDYRVSTNPSMDPNTITDTAWYTTIGVGGGQEYAAAFSQDIGGDGYGGPNWQVGDDVSAYCDDNAIGSDFTNYVWRIPAPGTAALLGVAGLMSTRRRR
jgi:hypothetical protein